MSGIFDFIKNVGEKVFGASESTPPQSDAVKKSIDTFNLGTKDVNVAVDGDKVILTGQVQDQSVLEKLILAAGNTLGIAKVDATSMKLAAAPASEDKSVFYTVKSGDTLWKIAEEQYGKGNGAKHTVIFEANTPMLKSPDKIYPGQMLRIPPLK